MPTLLNENGFKFFFYANEHPPAHVHILKGGAWAKIEIQTLNVAYSTLKQSELSDCLILLKRHQQTFLEAWHEWFGRKRSPF